METTNSEIGAQLSGQALYDRQKQIVAARTAVFDVRVAAIGIQAHANVGAILRGTPLPKLDRFKTGPADFGIR